MSEKRKREDLRTKPPSVYRHMMSWGAVSGYFLAWSFGVFASRIFGSDTLSVIEITSSLMMDFPLLVLFGSLPGIVIGVFLGDYIKNELKNRSSTDNLQDILPSQVRLNFYDFLVVFSIAFGIMSTFSWILLFVPSLLVGIVAIYVAHRYVMRLRRWARVRDSNVEKTKRDAHTARLVDYTQSEEMIESEIMPQMIQSQDAES